MPAKADANHRTLTQVLQHKRALPEPAIAQLLTLVLKKLVALNQPCGCVCSGAVKVPLGAVTNLPDLTPPTDEVCSSGDANRGLILRYLSPERGRPHDPTSVADDAWAVGVMAAECALAPAQLPRRLTGAHVDAPAVLTMLAQSASPALGAFVRACLSNDPSSRPASALAMLMQPFILQHAGASLWQLKEGRLQLQLTEEIVEAAALYYCELQYKCQLFSMFSIRKAVTMENLPWKMTYFH